MSSDAIKDNEIGYFNKNMPKGGFNECEGDSDRSSSAVSRERYACEAVIL